MSTNFPSARRQNQVGAILFRPKAQLRHYLNPTWVGFSKVPKYQLKHNLDTTPPKALLELYFVYSLEFFIKQTPSWWKVDFKLSFSPQERLLPRAQINWSWPLDRDHFLTLNTASGLTYHGEILLYAALFECRHLQFSRRLFISSSMEVFCV
jgi:hypothetical protein